MMSIAEIDPSGGVHSVARPTLSFVVPMADRAEFDALPDRAREDINDKLLAFEIIHGTPRNKKRLAIRNQAADFVGRAGFSEQRLATQYYQFKNTGDWRILINRSQSAGTGRSQPREFIQFWWSIVAKHKRSKRQARNELLRIWRTGLNLEGKGTSVPGYGFWKDWLLAQGHQGELPAEAPIPKGWTMSQLYRLAPLKVQTLLAREGIAAARKCLPDNRRTRVGLRFLEHVTFDDVKTDWRVFDPVSAQVVDLWLLVAIDTATGLVLAYWPLPAVERPDGKVTHLGQAEMKQLCGWVLERWGVPVEYPSTWKLERGTATLGEAVALAMQQLFNERVLVSYSSMISGRAPSGYAQRAVGNSRGKAGHEATNNLFHNMCDHLPAQTGSRYDRRPAELWGREAHVRECVKLMAELPAATRSEVRLPVLKLDQAREVLNDVFNRMNCRTEHELEGYTSEPFWRCSPQHEWEPIASYPDDGNKYETMMRKQSPLERAQALRAATSWERVPSSALVRFYQSSQRKVVVTEKGEIIFTERDVDYVFRPPVAQHLQEPFLPGAKFLAYFNTETKSMLHLTELPPHSGYVASLPRTFRSGYGDKDAAEVSLRYTSAARVAQETLARSLAPDEPARIAEINAHNAALLEESRATDISTPSALSPLTGTDQGSAVLPDGHRPTIVDAMEFAEQSTRDLVKRVRKARQDDEDLAALADEALMQSHYRPPTGKPE